MFDIGFFELLVILVVALLVIGPDKLPATARTVGLWVGRIKYQFQSAKRDFERELGADDIRRQLHNEQVMRELGETEEAIKKVMQEADEVVQSAKTDAEK